MTIAVIALAAAGCNLQSGSAPPEADVSGAADSLADEGTVTCTEAQVTRLARKQTYFDQLYGHRGYGNTNSDAQKSAIKACQAAHPSVASSCAVVQCQQRNF